MSDGEFSFVLARSAPGVADVFCSELDKNLGPRPTCIEQACPPASPFSCSAIETRIEECRLCISAELQLGAVPGAVNAAASTSPSSNPSSPFCAAAAADVVRALDAQQAKQQVDSAAEGVAAALQQHRRQRSQQPEQPARMCFSDGVQGQQPCEAVNQCTVSTCSVYSSKDAFSSSSVQSSTLTGTLANLSHLLSSTTTTTTVPGSLTSPPHGVKAVCGKRTKMEDAFCVHTNFFDLPLSPVDDGLNKFPARIAVQLEAAEFSPSSSVPLSPSTGPLPSDPEGSCGASSYNSECSCDTLHFFGVYDGHGGDEAAQHCATRLHHHLSEALSQLNIKWSCGYHRSSCAQHNNDSGNGQTWGASSCKGNECNGMAGDSQGLDLQKGSCDGTESSNNSAEAELDRSETSSNNSEDSAQTTSRCDSGCRSDGITTKVTALLEEALRNSFLNTDAEFSSDCSAAMVGSTAVVALVGRKKIWVANCGDSRAILCRSGKAYQLTDDHKPEREDEAERVEKAGGQVLYWNGHRVMGVLAMSRAIGDHGLRPYVIPEPEITVVCRHDDDEFMLLASDGLWDVMSNQEATNLALRCLKRAREKGASRKAAARIAASVLTKAAVDRGSKDNVTAIIIDLKLSCNGDAAVAAEGAQDGECCDSCGPTEASPASSSPVKASCAAPAVPATALSE